MTQLIQDRCPYCLSQITGDSCKKCRPDERVPNPDSLLPVGYVLAERYIIGSAVHSNSEATLYYAYDTVGDAVLSLREYYPKAISSRQEDGNIIPKPGKEVQFKALRMDFEEVCMYLSRQRPQACIIPCIDVLPSGDTVFGIFTTPSGNKLEKFLDERGGRLSWNEVKMPFLSLLSTVSALHRSGLIHRGISPTTLHWSAEGRLVLTGFGTSAFRTGHSEIEAELFYGYAAPEQYSQRGWQGNWTDNYALGAVLYRILTGQNPIDYHGRLTGETLVPPEDFDPTIPHHVSDAVMQAMSIDLEERYQSADTFYSALLDSVPGSTAVFDAAESLPERRRPKKRRRVIFLLVFIIVFGALASGGILVAYHNNAFAPFGFADHRVKDKPQTKTKTSNEGRVIPEPEPEPIIVPPLAGSVFDDLLRDPEFINKYKLSEPVMVYNDEVPEGTIIDQIPKAGEELTESESISLTVSLGKEFTTMPNIIGWTIEEAKRELDIWGIKYNDEVLKVVGEGYVNGIVVRASIEAGAEISRKDQVVYLYTGRD